MVRHQFSVRTPQGQPGGLAAEFSVLPPEMREAILEVNAAYAALGVPYALVGGLAAGSYGDPRFTKDIDFLVGDAAFQTHGRLVSFAKPLPLQSGGFAVDPIALPEDARRHKILADAVAHPVIDTTTGAAVPMLDATSLAYMKLASPRSKDRGDIVAMLRTGSVDAERLVVMIDGDEVLAQRFDATLSEYEDLADAE